MGSYCVSLCSHSGALPSDFAGEVFLHRRCYLLEDKTIVKVRPERNTAMT